MWLDPREYVIVYRKMLIDAESDFGSVGRLNTVELQDQSIEHGFQALNMSEIEDRLLPIPLVRFAH